MKHRKKHGKTEQKQDRHNDRQINIQKQNTQRKSKQAT